MTTVIKLGGSLLAANALMECLANMESRPGFTVIVPGGGVFADQVREAQQVCHFDQQTAHRMAILAMQQMALLLRGLKPTFSLVDDWRLLKIQAAGESAVAIWSPDYRQLDVAGVPASWDITSDSIAAWLANKIDADQLILIKAAAVVGAQSIAELQQAGIVDGAFDQFCAGCRFKMRILNFATFCQT